MIYQAEICPQQRKRRPSRESRVTGSRALGRAECVPQAWAPSWACLEYLQYLTPLEHAQFGL